jgi:hypothetical protein
VDDLAELEALKQLKARYCRLLDAKDWDGWRQLFADDFVSDTSPSGGRKVEGADAFVSYVRKHLGKPSQTTVHMVHAPELRLSSSSTAAGVWALEDFVRFAPGFKLRGYGHYHETYAKVRDDWRFATSTLTRVREDVITPLGTYQLTDRVKRVAHRLAPGVGK